MDTMVTYHDLSDLRVGLNQTLLHLLHHMSQWDDSKYTAEGVLTSRWESDRA